MPFSGKAVSASIAHLEDDQVALSFNNSTSRPVSFWVFGVFPDKVGFELDGNTRWQTVVKRVPHAKIVEVRQGDLLGPTLAYEEVIRAD